MKLTTNICKRKMLLNLYLNSAHYAKCLRYFLVVITITLFNSDHFNLKKKI